MNIYKTANINRTYPFSLENAFCSFFPKPEIDYLHLIKSFTVILIYTSLWFG